jgi:UDP-N-acetyl-2-amino-2-deoxyglucuronate dehydrogenase
MAIGQKNFALIGAAGFVAPRHLKAIKDTGNTLIAALDPHDSVGILDSYFPDTHFFTSYERFERHLEKLHYHQDGQHVDYVSICSPNYLHDTHIRLALHVDAHAVCEKPLVINPANLHTLAELQARTGKSVSTILQLRLHPALIALREQMQSNSAGEKRQVVLTYVTRRGQWYHVSWKGDPEKSGGLVMNIGIHLFDLLIWLFGSVETFELHLTKNDKMAGMIELERACVSWYLSVDSHDLPENKAHAFRSITIDGQEIEFSEGFTDLHTRAYEEIFAGHGFGLDAAKPSLDLVYGIRHADLALKPAQLHPILLR